MSPHRGSDSAVTGVQAVLLMAKAASRVLCLSGTPMLSRPSEIYMQLLTVGVTYVLCWLLAHLL